MRAAGKMAKRCSGPRKSIHLPKHTDHWERDNLPAPDLEVDAPQRLDVPVSFRYSSQFRD